MCACVWSCQFSSVVCVRKISLDASCAFYKLTVIASRLLPISACGVVTAAAAAAADSLGAAHGGKTESARQPGPAHRASGRTAVQPARRRWVPPSTLRNHVAVSDNADNDAKHDIIFRKVRGILNKLTPEKFQKLSGDLLALSLDSDKVLKGVILLIFEKALDEPKYSSMYAQLCKRLSEEAPNLEPAGQPCTFKLLLLNRCRAEFEGRAQAFAAFDEGAALPPEEAERRHLAKCKMLGNIKFIGELGKLEILSESILHRCIQNLLARRAAVDHHEDLECLAQLVRTCGRVLDSERGRGLMEQYFARIDTLSRCPELAPRIRFMLRDVVELRRGGWVPRAATHGEGPVPIQQLRPDDEPPRRAPQPADPLFRGGLRARPLDDVLAGLTLAPSQHQAPPDKLFGNGFASRDAFRQRSAPSYYPRGAHHAPAKGAGNANNANSNKEGAPRFNKARLAAAAAGGALADVQMRPAANSLLFTANRLTKPPAAALPLAPLPQNVLAPTFTSAAPLLKEAAITIKPAPDKKDKLKKDKAITKEEVSRLAVEAAREVRAACGAGGAAAGGAGGGEEGGAEPAALRAAAERLRDLQLPDKLLRRAVAALLDHALADEEGGSEWACAALIRSIKRGPVSEPVRTLLQTKHAHPRTPSLLAHLIAQKLVPLAEVGALCEGGAHYPLLLEVLQQLHALVGMERLQALYAESKINLCAYVSEGTGGGGGGGGAVVGGAAAEAVEARGLSALVPQLRLQAELARQLAREPGPAALYRWIKLHVEPAVRQHAAFVSALVALIAGHVTASAGCHAASATRDELERERSLVEAYAPLLTALLDRRPELQLAAVYAVQVHAHQHNYPKGMLLRWFMYLYNLEVCEEEAFLRWREDVTDAYPGKGEALFQVNTWLTWLQQQESEDEEAED